MTSLTVTEDQFVSFVAEHRGDYVGASARVVQAFVESISRDGAELLRILTRQVPAFELVTGQLVPALDGTRPLPTYERGTHQVVPAQGLCRIGHVVQLRDGWAGFHYRSPYKSCIRGVDQLAAVIGVHVAHFATL